MQRQLQYEQHQKLTDCSVLNSTVHALRRPIYYRKFRTDAEVDPLRQGSCPRRTLPRFTKVPPVH